MIGVAMGCGGNTFASTSGKISPSGISAASADSLAATTAAASINSTVTSSAIVGMRPLAAICSTVCELASTNSTNLVAAGDFASGRTASTCPIAASAL